MPKIMLVDDDVNVLKACRRCLRKLPWEIVEFDAPEKALEVVSDESWNMVISDYRMPKMDGIEFLTQVRKINPNPILIIMSANIDLEGLANALNNVGIHRFISKPWDDGILIQTIHEALNLQKLLEENQRLADEVRAQKEIIDSQQSELQRLESESPGITQVDWDEDGAIVLDDSDFE